MLWITAWFFLFLCIGVGAPRLVESYDTLIDFWEERLNYFANPQGYLGIYPMFLFIRHRRFLLYLTALELSIGIGLGLQDPLGLLQLILASVISTLGFALFLGLILYLINLGTK